MTTGARLAAGIDPVSVRAGREPVTALKEPVASSVLNMPVVHGVRTGLNPTSSRSLSLAS